jgi:hypothetical protein
MTIFFLIPLVILLLLAAGIFLVASIEDEFKNPLPIAAAVWIISLITSLGLAMWYLPQTSL